MSRQAWRQKTRSFGFQMAFFYLAAGIGILLLFGGVVYLVVSNIFVKEAVEKTQMAIEKNAQGIGDILQNTQTALLLTGQNPAFTAKMPATPAQRESVQRQLDTVQGTSPYLFGVYAVLPDGTAIGNTKAPPPSPALAQGFLANTSPTQPQLTSATANRYAHKDGWVVTLSVPILAADGQKQGLLLADLDYCLFKHTISDFGMGAGGSVFVLDDSGTLAFHTDTACMAAASSGEPFLAPTFFGYNPEENTLTHSAAIAGTGWALVGIASLDSLLVLQRQLLDLIVLTGVLLFLALLLITLIVSKRLTTPLSRLAKSMEDIEHLAELSLLKNELAETQMLTQSYNHMVRKLRQMKEVLEHNQTELRQREMDTLTSQINPHFLYNTLDTIVWLAEFRDNDKIIALTKSLAAFFRLSLSGGRAVVSIGEEMEHVKQYLFIQKQRYGDKLSDSFEIDKSLQDFMLPKIVLQPLVENAIYHGIKPMDGNGLIKIEAYWRNGVPVLSVQDNGVGFAPSQKTPEDPTSGVGLRNVERRLQLYFGTEAGVEIFSAPLAGTTVTLVLAGPARVPPKES